MSKHTPGPWKIEFDTNVMGIRSDVGHKGAIANTAVHSSSEVDCLHESMANARLIAAAPDLLIACEAIVHAARLNDPAVGAVAATLAMRAIEKASEETGQGEDAGSTPAP